ncbi:MAG: hypothetical protein GY856_09690, partial [bacterium]|nr:hypothetical protein [bacterium]
YVRSLEPGETQDPDLFAAVWDKLRDALIAELRRRSLWGAPPSYLGICGAAGWSDQDALDELVTDCYTFIFLDRLPGLKAQLKVKPNVEGLVFRGIHNFLYDTQKRHDPLGFGVFGVLQSAVRQSVTAGTLHVLAGAPGVGNDTVLGFAPDHDPEQARGAGLAELVKVWNDDLLPELVTARGKVRDQVTTRLATHLSRLPLRGIEAFRFKDVIDPLKNDVRARWSAVRVQSEGETAVEDGDEDLMVIVRQVRPDSGVEERESFEKLLAGVAEALEGIDESARTRAYLETLWAFLRSHAAESPEEGSATDPADPKAYELPSRRKT